ncbi:MAG: hypothetical protein ACRYHA_22570 [Janthinobacterium lividum]
MTASVFSLVLLVVVATASPGGATTLAAASGVRFARLLRTPRRRRMLNLATGVPLAVSIVPLWR